MVEIPVVVRGEAPVIAPLWKRGVAGAVDSLPFLSLALAVREKDFGAGRPQRGLRLLAFAMSAAYCIPLTARHGQTLGQMVLGIRVVDADTGALPSPMQAAVRWTVAMVPDALARVVPLSQRVETELAAIRELQPEIDRLTDRYEAEPERLNEELMSLFREAGVNPVGACLPIIVRALPSLAMSCALYAPLLKGAQHQAVHDRVAGTVVVEARGVKLRG